MVNNAYVGGGVSIVGVILMVVAIIVNKLFYCESETLTIETSTRYGWDYVDTCLGDNCVTAQIDDGCQLCKDFGQDDCDACKYQMAGQSWLALNVIGAVALAGSALLAFMGKGGKMIKGAAGVGSLCAALALIVVYAVASDTGFWNTDTDRQMVDVSGWLDIVAFVAGIIAAVMG
eukprot:CAMPEP_0197020900 /NCGR_PEP_ID=MMETSP1384-20130603/1766_1 /TAXON_ID=29189 /ORGANISM="Ammonia sp." /LENGTH=174 /DNA_ID=CAMNT_0042448623 /DNA_START=28 /DNA_END=552 /DNA_ORIENTATION=-